MVIVAGRHRRHAPRSSGSIIDVPRWYITRPLLLSLQRVCFDCEQRGCVQDTSRLHATQGTSQSVCAHEHKMARMCTPPVETVAAAKFNDDVTAPNLPTHRYNRPNTLAPPTPIDTAIHIPLKPRTHTDTHRHRTRTLHVAHHSSSQFGTM